MEEALTALLLSLAGVTALAGQRVNWNERPQADALPAVVLQLITGPRGYHLRGPDGLTGYLVQCECWGLSFAEAKGLARAIEAGGSGYQDATLRGAFIENERDDVFRDAPETLHRTSLDLRVWHKQA